MAKIRFWIGFMSVAVVCFNRLVQALSGIHLRQARVML